LDLSFVKNPPHRFIIHKTLSFQRTYKDNHLRASHVALVLFGARSVASKREKMPLQQLEPSCRSILHFISSTNIQDIRIISVRIQLYRFYCTYQQIFPTGKGTFSPAFVNQLG